jgi:hypothetical protein
MRLAALGRGEGARVDAGYRFEILRAREEGFPAAPHDADGAVRNPVLLCQAVASIHIRRAMGRPAMPQPISPILISVVRDSLGQRNLEREQRFSFDPWCQERDLRS